MAACATNSSATHSNSSAAVLKGLGFYTSLAHPNIISESLRLLVAFVQSFEGAFESHTDATPMSTSAVNKEQSAFILKVRSTSSLLALLEVLTHVLSLVSNSNSNSNNNSHSVEGSGSDGGDKGSVEADVATWIKKAKTTFNQF